VDSIGIGAGVADRLFELGLPAVGINVSENPALLSELVHRQRDELWWNAKVWLESRECVIPNNERLVNELVSIRKGFTSAGKIQVESKDQMKRRGLRSPDVADAFVLTFAFTSPMNTFMSKSNSDWKTPISRTSDGTYV
jgi:phage terminase large subunit